MVSIAPLIVVFCMVPRSLRSERQGSGNHFWGVRGARHRRTSAGMIAPPILARFASGNGARSARGFREPKHAFRKRPTASSFSRKLKWSERPLARTTIRVTSSAERFSGKRKNRRAGLCPESYLPAQKDNNPLKPSCPLRLAQPNGRCLPLETRYFRLESGRPTSRSRLTP
jgi:hypothetical protein